jgi:FKBP-type peptidyl-prolyl cis-trans isomerase FklB
MPPKIIMKLVYSSLTAALLFFVTGCGIAPGDEKKKGGTATSENVKVSAPTPVNDGGGAALAAAVSSADGMVTTASGLRYRVLASGPAGGRSPGFFNSVVVHYRGTLTDGTVFDSSIERGQPATFGVGQVIPGWTEALRLMKPGDEWLVYIPSRLAYGSQAVGSKIPPNSDLIFQMALLQVVGAQ